jgi:hypothetical protein
MLNLPRSAPAIAVAAALLLPVVPAAHAGQSGTAASVPSKPVHRRAIVQPPIYNSVPVPPIYNLAPPPVLRDPYDPFDDPNFHGYNGG